MKSFFKENENRIVFFILLFSVVCACAPLFTRLCINGHDLEYHLLRIESLKEGILAGRPFLKVNMLFFGGAGYASSMFYPDFLLYFPAVLRAIGVSINASYHAFAGLCILLCGLSSYFCGKGITGSKYAGLIIAVLLTFCNYHIEDIYVRSAVGEYTAFIFLPLVIYGVFNALYEGMDKPYILGAGFLGLILCHTGSFVICLFFCFAVFLFNLKIFMEDPKIFKRLIATAGITAGISCFYWLPVLEQLKSAVFYVSTPWVRPVDEAGTFIGLFSSVFPSIGAPLILIYALRLLVRREPGTGLSKHEGLKSTPSYDNASGSALGAENYRGGLLRFADTLYIIGAFAALLSTRLFPWERFGDYMTFMQFPWRFYIISSAFFAFADGILLYRFFRSGLERSSKDKAETASVSLKDGACPLSVLSVAVFILSALSAFTVMERNDQGYYDYSDDYYSHLPFTANVIAGEWLPETVTEKEDIVPESGRAVSDTGEELRFERNKNEIALSVDRAYEYADVPFIYYKGYEALCSNGERLRIDGSGKNGFARVYFDNGEKGDIIVRYAGTKAQAVSKLVSAIAVLLCLGVFVKGFRERG